MSTHAEVFIELEDGSVTGTYVHFDGYPRTCGAGLEAHSYDDVRKAVLRAQTRGGLRCIYPDKIEGYDDRKNCIIRTLKDARERYVYVKNRDGSVDMVADGVRMRLNTGQPGSPVAVLELMGFLYEECSALCMDSQMDRLVIAEKLLEKFSISRK